MKTFILTALLLLMSVGGALAQRDGRDGHELLGLTTHPYTGFTASRFSGMEDWSVGAEFGVEADLQAGYVDVKLELHDILTGADSEIVPWDQTFSVAAGFYW